jgi:hypothetical protein
MKEAAKFKELPKPISGFDVLTPRGSNLDSFVRRVESSGQICWNTQALQFDELGAFHERGGDQDVHDMMSHPPDLTALVNSTVVIEYEGPDQEPVRGTGVRISDDIVITCEHLLEDLLPHNPIFVMFDKATESQRYLAVVEEMTSVEKSLSEECFPNCMNADDICWEEYLDIVFLRVMLMPPVDGPLLSISRKLEWGFGDVVIAAGFPGVLEPAEYHKYLPTALLRELARLEKNRADEIGQALINNFNQLPPGKIISMGVIKRCDLPRPNLKYGSYVFTTSSSTFGMSGGPVVSAQDPSKLAGIMVGGEVQRGGVMLLSFQDEAILAILDRLVKSRISI